MTSHAPEWRHTFRKVRPQQISSASSHPSVYNGEQRWNAARTSATFLAPVPAELLGYLPRHRYLPIDIQALDASQLPPDNVLSIEFRKEEEAKMTTLLDRAKKWGGERDQHG